MPFEEEALGYERGTMVVEKPRGTRGTVRYSSECGWTQFVVTSKQRNDNKHHRKKRHIICLKKQAFERRA